MWILTAWSGSNCLFESTKQTGVVPPIVVQSKMPHGSARLLGGRHPLHPTESSRFFWNRLKEVIFVWVVGDLEKGSDKSRSRAATFAVHLLSPSRSHQPTSGGWEGLGLSERISPLFFPRFVALVGVTFRAGIYPELAFVQGKMYRLRVLFCFPCDV